MTPDGKCLPPPSPLCSTITCECLQSPPYSSGSYDSVKTDLSVSAEDLTSARAQMMDDDDDDHDDHDDSDKINDAEGMDPERLKAFNVSNNDALRESGLMLNK